MRPRPRLRLPLRSRRGIALIVTLLVIVVLTIAVTAFMQSMGLERRTSQAYLNLLKADGAVNSGLEKVKSILTSKTNNDTFTIVKIEATASNGAYYFIGTGNDVVSGAAKTSATTTYTPLFSYLDSPGAMEPVTTPTVGASNNKPALPAISASIAANSKPILQAGMLPVNTSWEAIQTGDAQFPTIRYSYWVEDLSSRVDAGVAGNKLEVVGNSDTLQNQENNDKHLRNGSFSASQLGVFTIFAKTARTDPGGTPAGLLYDSRSLFLTSSSVKQALSTTYTTYKSEMDESVTANLSGDMEAQIIPNGLGFTHGGDVKLDVNAVIADGTVSSEQKVTKIARVISENLPKFDRRKGANYGRFKDPSEPAAVGRHDYVKTIAASIIDYADTDNLGTVGDDYRGVDSYPFISEWTHKSVYTPSTVPEAGVWKTQVAVTPYLELWNLSDQTINGKFKFKENNTDSFPNGTATAVFTDTSSIVNVNDVDREYTITSLAPNEYRVIQLATLNYKFPAGTNQPFFTSGGPNVNSPAKYTSGYNFIWEGSVVDEPYGKQEAVNRILTSGTPIWRSYLPGFRYNYPEDLTFVYFWDAMGDPRSTFYLKRTVAINTFNSGSANSNRQTWGGRNSWNLPAETYAEREVNPSKWLDVNHGNSSLGTSVANTGDPTSAPSKPTLQQEAVSSISNRGSYLSMTELGNIYDPAQWNAKGPAKTNSTIPNYAPLATDIPADAGDDLNSGAEGWGGGFTLRIGRSEYTRFTKPDTEPAWKLLDLLSAGSAKNTAGLININTASKDALRTLVAGSIYNADPGIRINNAVNNNTSADPALIPKTYPYSSSYPVASPATQADVIAQAIIDGRPYLSTSQLSNLKILNTTNAVFGDKSRWLATDPARPTEWDDAGAEEMFKSVYELGTVRSRNFNVYITGQVLNRQGKPAATSSKVFQIAIVPTRDAATKSIMHLIIQQKNEASPL